MNEDRVVWRDEMLLSDVVPLYAYPGELEGLARLARQFPGVRRVSSDCEAMDDANFALVDGLGEAGHGDFNAPREYWTEELGLAIDAINYPGGLVAAWRAFGELPPEERWSVIDGAWRLA